MKIRRPRAGYDEVDPPVEWDHTTRWPIGKRTKLRIAIPTGWDYDRVDLFNAGTINGAEGQVLFNAFEQDGYILEIIFKKVEN